MLHIEQADLSDADDILTLQKQAYQSEALIYNDWTLPPLLQTKDDIEREFTQSVFLKALIHNQIVGSIRFFREGSRVFIGRLIVDPRFQRQGIGTQLLQAAEHYWQDALVFELFTGHKSESNIRLYQNHGYQVSRTDAISPQLSLIYLEKHSSIMHIEPTNALNTLKQNNTLFAELFRHGSLSLEIYKPSGEDAQQPHSRDEVYVIISGHGTFNNGGARHPFAAGDFIFVPAGVEHRFETFSDDFLTWVIFYDPEGGEHASN